MLSLLLCLGLHGLCHEAAHLFCGLLLHPVGGVGVDTQGEARVVVAQHTGYRFHIDAVLERHGCEGVPKSWNSIFDFYCTIS